MPSLKNIMFVISLTGKLDPEGAGYFMYINVDDRGRYFSLRISSRQVPGTFSEIPYPIFRMLKDKIKCISKDDILKLNWYEPPLIFVMAILNILICNCNFIYQQYQDLSLD